MKDVRPVKAGWYNAFRPWTLHGAVIPVLIGGAVAYHDDLFNIWILILILIGGCLLQSAANLLNTYGDFEKGTDTVENRHRSPELVTGTLKPKKVLFAGLACLGITALIGLVLIWYAGWGILIFGIIGIIGAGTYTIGMSYKYHGLGLVSVFLLMGMLMPAGTYYTLTGTLTWELVLISLPNAFLITAVLSGNETRDYYEDKKANVGTLSGMLDYQGCMSLYRSLNAIAFPAIVLLVIFGIIPWMSLLALVALYDLHLLMKNSKHAHEDKMSNIRLVPLSFKLNWHFGLLLMVGYLIGHYAIPVLL